MYLNNGQIGIDNVYERIAVAEGVEAGTAGAGSDITRRVTKEFINGAEPSVSQSFTALEGWKTMIQEELAKSEVVGPKMERLARAVQGLADVARLGLIVSAVESRHGEVLGEIASALRPENTDGLKV